MTIFNTSTLPAYEPQEQTERNSLYIAIHVSFDPLYNYSQQLSVILLSIGQVT